MFRSARMGAAAYATLGMETGVAAADPHELVLMLFSGARAAVSAALHHMATGNVEEKGRAVSKAVMIIEGGLRASLNTEVGGDLARSLDGLYEYMSRRLMLGHARNQPDPLEEVQSLLGELGMAWSSISDISQSARPFVAARENVMPVDELPRMKA